MPRRPLPTASEVPLYQGDLQQDLQLVSRNQLAEKITGGLSKTEKMPSASWGISATRCRLGSVLAKKEGSTCASCYALKGRYAFTNVQKKLEERYQGLFNPLWTPAMVFLIRWYCDEYFRWFDSGDVQGLNHLKNICTVAKHTPDVKHWLPTREAEVAHVVQETGLVPSNLVLRVSGAMIDGKPPRGFDHVSTVVSDVSLTPEDAFACPSRDQSNSCQSCRECWNPDTPNIAYRLH